MAVGIALAAGNGCKPGGEGVQEWLAVRAVGAVVRRFIEVYLMELVSFQITIPQDLLFLPGSNISAKKACKRMVPQRDNQRRGIAVSMTSRYRFRRWFWAWGMEGCKNSVSRPKLDAWGGVEDLAAGLFR